MGRHYNAATNPMPHPLTSKVPSFPTPSHTLQGGHIEAVRILLAHGAVVDEGVMAAGVTPLYIAVQVWDWAQVWETS